MIFQLEHVQYIIHSAKDCIPVHQHKCVAGWNDSASFLKQQASFWHQIWTECGSPSAGIVAQIKKKAKLCYKAEARRRKRQQSYIRRQKRFLEGSEKGKQYQVSWSYCPCD